MVELVLAVIGTVAGVVVAIAAVIPYVRGRKKPDADPQPELPADRKKHARVRFIEW